MNLTEYTGAESAFPMFLVKFGELDHMKALQSGCLYMKNLGYFIDLEKKTGVKGRGDRLEGAYVLADLEAVISDPETGEKVRLASVSSMHFRTDWIRERPVFCLFTITSDMFELDGEKHNQMVFKLTFTEKQKEKIEKEFGDSALFISFDPFVQQIDSVFKETGLQYKRGLVNYYDYSVNEAVRLELMKKFGHLDICFAKDQVYKYQNEYRVIIQNIDVLEDYQIELGELTGTKLIKTESLLSGDLELRRPLIQKE
ncbi:hypothetical protein [Bacillus sp. JJ722]|uniref:hypothetical protein n=1 Tax=Bacillus sp. JJ722 TaxID=3122973 RepID=UPI002FFE6722